MKKLLLIILLAAVFGLSGCVATMNDLENYKKEQSAQGQETRMRLAAIEAGAGVTPKDIEKLLEGSEVTKIRAFTGLEGDTTGTLDKIDTADILDGDIGLVFTPAGGIYFYTYEDSDTQAEASPYVIYANDRAGGPGAWLLQSGFYMGRSALPANVFRDSGATDYDDNARIYANCDDGSCASGSEDVDVYFQAQIGGTANTTWLHFDCDASGNCDIDFIPAGTGGLDFGAANVGNVGAITAAGIIDGLNNVTVALDGTENANTTGLLSQYIINKHATSGTALTVTLNPTPQLGMQLLVKNGKGTGGVNTGAITLATGASIIIWNPTTKDDCAAGEDLVSGGAAGDFIGVVGVDSTHYDTIGYQGTWTCQ